MRTSAGCGSIATTRAPSRRKAAMRSPTWAPASNTRSPGLTKPRIEPVHGGAVPAVAVIDAKRPGDAAGGSQALEQPHCQAAADDAGAAAIAGSASACDPTGAAVSSGRRPMPARTKAAPTAGQAVSTASGIDSASPAASGNA